MPVRIKFCGLTRAEDVEAADALDADYVGVIFAGGPRTRTEREAASLLLYAKKAVSVGVFGTGTTAEIMRYVSAVPLSVVQLHRTASVESIADLRNRGASEVWALVTVTDGELAAGAAELFQAADAIVLDTGAANGLGGTGRTFQWDRVAGKLAQMDRSAKLIVAGGLTPENVREAVRALHPDVVDVSSGVESAPGVKDSLQMRRFAEAARSA